MKTKLFRSKLSPRETLAIDPRALEVEYYVQEAKANEQQSRIAIVSICGPLEHHRSWIWDSYDSILERLESAFCDDDVSCVIMCIDSPGGDAAGATEAHRNIQRLKKRYKKPLFAYSNEAMYSAAYSIGSAADEIWVPETGGVGSVGVICALLDKTKQNEKLGLNIKLLTTGARKADSHADRELTDDVVSAMQERVDYLGDVFFRTVAKARGMSPKDVQNLEAGVFLGQEAVDSGLADGVAGWYKFLLYVGGKIDAEANASLTSQNSESDKEHAMTLEQLKKAKELAAKKLAAAKSSAERTKLFSAYEKAATALAEFSAKTKYVKKTEEKLEKDDEEEEEEETDEEEEEEEEDDDGDDDDDSDDDSDEEEEEEEEEETEDEEKMKKSSKKAAALMSLKNVEKLFSAVVKFTGKRDVSEICGALEGMSPRVKNMPKIEKRLASIEQVNLKSRVTQMLDAAKAERKVTKGEYKSLLAQGMKDPKWLKGYLSTKSPVVRSLDEEVVPNLDASSPNLDQQGLSSDQKKMLQQAAHSAGMSVEDYTKEIAKHNTNKPNGVTPRF